MDTSETQRVSPSDSSPFPETLWSVVLQASKGDPEKSTQALRRLCEIYRQPILHRLLRQGYGQEAEDLANSFIVFLLERNRLENFSRGTSKFRSFLLQCLKGFLRDVWRKDMAAKRGSGEKALSLDDHQVGEEETFDRVTDRHFALATHERVMKALADRYKAAGQEQRFQELKRFTLGDDPEISYEQVGGRLCIKIGAVKKAVFDLRERYCDLFREEVLQTVSSRESGDEEMRYLITLLADSDVKA